VETEKVCGRLVTSSSQLSELEAAKVIAQLAKAATGRRKGGSDG
jgi:hypothetical protein